MAGVYMDKQVSGKVKILTGGNGTTGIHNAHTEARDPRKRLIR